jgi:hypothetical protein
LGKLGLNKDKKPPQGGDTQVERHTGLIMKKNAEIRRMNLNRLILENHKDKG